MRLLLCAFLPMVISETAQAQLVLCNRTGQTVQAAVTEDKIDDETVVVRGWTAIAPGACAEVSDSFLFDHAFFAYQPGTGRTWEDDREGPHLCVRMGRNFRIQYENLGLEFDRVGEFE